MSIDSLPVGWTVTNRDGNFTGPPPRDDEDEAVAEELEEEGLDVRPDSPGWEDANADDDEEQISVKCFFSDEVFPSAQAMVKHCEEKNDFNFRQVIKTNSMSILFITSKLSAPLRTFTDCPTELDFLQTIKLVNYIRSEFANGRISAQLLNVNDPKLWEDDKYLQPAIEDDSMLFCLGEFAEVADAEQAEDIVMEGAPTDGT